MPLSIRNMRLEELKIAMEWAINEGWNVGKYDAEPYFKADPEGFKLLLIDDNPIGCISVVKHSDRYAFIGLFIILKEYRNKGYGTYLFHNTLDLLKQRMNLDATVGLYAVTPEVPRYQKLGFSSAYINHRFLTKAPDNLSSQLPLSLLCANSSSLFSKLSDYDAKIFCAPRQELLINLLAMPGTKTFVIMDEGNVTGYGMIRKCHDGFRIGPLYADNLDKAKILFEDLLNALATTGQNIIMDMPSCNKFSHLLASYFNLTRVKEIDTEAMFNNNNFPNETINNDKNYAICSLELG